MLLRNIYLNLNLYDYNKTKKKRRSLALDKNAVVSFTLF